MISKLLVFFQKLIVADKSALVSSALAAITLLAANFGFNLNASVTAYVGVLLTLLAGAFTHIHFARKASARKP